MIWKIVLTLVVAVSVQGEEGAVSEQKVVIHHTKHAEIAGAAEGKEENHKDYAWSYPSYEFYYKVKDPHTHDIKGQNEERDGDKVKGDYWLIEPTGRKRTVKYHADDHIGFNAQVDFSESEHSLQEKDQNNQVEEPKNINEEPQKEHQNYEVTEIIGKEEEINLSKSKEQNENKDEKEKQETLNDQENNNKEENEWKNEKEEDNNENDGNGSEGEKQEENKEENREENNNIKEEEESNAKGYNEAAKENTESHDNCNCHGRRKKDHGTQINNRKNYNNGGPAIRLRNKRRNNDRGANAKKGSNGHSTKTVEPAEGEHKNYRNSRRSVVKKHIQNENINEAKTIENSNNYGKRIEVSKRNDIKESESIDQNDNESKYQHRILIHHPKIVLATPRKS